MPQQELLKKVIRVLEGANIPYMLTGSVASSLQGEPRSTHDIDVVISLQKTAIKKLLAAFRPPQFYLDEASIMAAVEKDDMFNLIDAKEGDKVDFWMLTDNPFDQARFSRRQPEKIMGMKMQISSPEDTILAKLRWAKLSGGSEKHFTDALRVYEVQFQKLDIEYLSMWAKKLQLEILWERLKGMAKTI